MKKILSVVLVLCMLFTGCFMLFSCNNPAANEGEKKLTVEDLENNPTLIAVGASKALTAFFDVAGVSNVLNGMNKGAVSLIVDNADLKDGIGLGKTELTIYSDTQNNLLNKLAVKVNAAYADETYGGILYVDKDGIGVAGESIFGTEDAYKVDILNLMKNFESSALKDMLGGEAASEIVGTSFTLLTDSWKMLFVETVEDSPYNEMIEWSNNAIKEFKPVVKAETVDGVEALTVTYEITNDTIEAYLNSVVENVPEHYMDVMSNFVDKMGLDLSFDKETIEEGMELIIDRMNLSLVIDLKMTATIACEGGALLNSAIKGDVTPAEELVPNAEDMKISVEMTMDASADAIAFEMKMLADLGEEMGKADISEAINLSKKTEGGNIVIKVDADVAAQIPSMEEKMEYNDIVVLTATYAADGALNVEAEVNVPESEKIEATLTGSILVKDGKATIAIDSIAAESFGFEVSDLGISIVIDPTAEVPTPEGAKEIMSLTSEELMALVESVSNGPLADLFGGF